MILFFSLEGRRLETHAEGSDAVGRVLNSDQLVSGEEVEMFEDEFALMTCSDYAIGVGSGLDALRIGLESLGVGKGDEVLVPAFTFVATWLAVLQVGAVPVGVDVDLQSGLINAAAVEAQISNKTVGILCVHLYGRAAPLDELASIAARHGLFLAEDAAQAHGLEELCSENRQVAFSAYSFYPTKNLGSIGNAGAICSNSSDVRDRAATLRNYGAPPSDKYHHEQIGLNSRLDSIQAAALRVFLPHLSTWNARRRSLASRYLETLANVELFEPLDPWVSVDSSVWHLFVVRTQNRTKMVESLERSGIRSGIHYPELAATCPAFRDLGYVPEDFPKGSTLAGSVLSLPMHPWLESESDRLMDGLLAASELDAQEKR